MITKPFGKEAGELPSFLLSTHWDDVSYLRVQKDFGQLRNRCNKATQMFADRVYVEESLVQMMCHLDSIYEYFDVDNINKVLEDMHMHVNNLIEDAWRGIDYGD